MQIHQFVVITTFGLATLRAAATVVFVYNKPSDLILTRIGFDITFRTFTQPAA